MFQPELLYEVNQLRQMDLRQEAASARLMRTHQPSSYAVPQLAQQLSIRLNHWVITLSFHFETRFIDETY